MEGYHFDCAGSPCLYCLLPDVASSSTSWYDRYLYLTEKYRDLNDIIMASRLTWHQLGTNNNVDATLATVLDFPAGSLSGCFAIVDYCRDIDGWRALLDKAALLKYHTFSLKVRGCSQGL
jgi:hypothetical protein